MDLPSCLKLAYSREQIQKRVKELAEEITPWAIQVREKTGEDVLGIPVLRGGLFFFVDLVREIEVSIGVAPVRAWSYDSAQIAVQLEEVMVEFDKSLPVGRSVLLIDDICDSGRTLQVLHDKFAEWGAAEVKSVAILRRDVKGRTFHPDFVGFEWEGPEWFVGYGMEMKDQYRNLSAIYTISNTY